jgi:hypothetical protein
MIEKFLGRENKLSTEFFPELIEKLFFKKPVFRFSVRFVHIAMTASGAWVVR